MPRPQTLQTRISHLLSHWPSDFVRPPSVSIQSYLQTRLSQVAQDASESASALSTRSAAPPHNPAQQYQSQPHLQSQPPERIQENVEMSEASLNALSSLLEDRYARRFPLSPRLRKPASDPEHYDNVVKEFEEAPERDWVGRLGKKLRGLFRFS